MVASRENFPLLDELLAEQQRLQTPVARFAGAHDGGSVAQLAALRSQLIPLTKPHPGEQYAFEVELDACTGCKACVAACHSLNGLDEHESWRDVGLIVGGDERHPFQQNVTTACHHCADPACLNGCPVLAYEKDPTTGIVRHLDDQCIGCQYCILKCPYDVPKYNARLGIVRKCDMCHDRLAEGEAPACVQACPTHAIRIVTVGVSVTGRDEQAERRPAHARRQPALEAASVTIRPNALLRADTSAFLSAAPDPGYTQPTTRYVTQRVSLAKLSAADAPVLRPQPPHWPLAFMLTLLPLGVGCQLAAAVLVRADPGGGVMQGVTRFGFIAGVLGLVASGAHLGRPLRAWRIFLGWRRSWLSREAIVFGAWAVAGAGAIEQPALRPIAAALGMAGLFCSVMIYVDTQRVFWRFAQTAPRFFGSMVLLGFAAALAFGLAPGGCAFVLTCATLAKLGCELRAVRPLNFADDDSPPTAALQTARLLAGPLRAIFGLRGLGALVMGVMLPWLLVAGAVAPVCGWAIFGGIFFCELAERYLFFRAVDAPKMPGVPA